MGDTPALRRCTKDSTETLKALALECCCRADREARRRSGGTLRSTDDTDKVPRCWDGTSFRVTKNSWSNEVRGEGGVAQPRVVRWRVSGWAGGRAGTGE